MLAAHNGGPDRQMARQRLGQHFLTDPAVLERIRASLPLHPNSIWLESDAGHAEMPQHLLGEGRRAIAAVTKPPATKPPVTKPPVMKPEDPARTSPPTPRSAKWNGLLVSRQRAFLTLELALNGLSALHDRARIPARGISVSSIIGSTSRPMPAPSTRSSSAKPPTDCLVSGANLMANYPRSTSFTRSRQQFLSVRSEGE